MKCPREYRNIFRKSAVLGNTSPNSPLLLSTTLICYLTESGDVGSSRWESLKEGGERGGGGEGGGGGAFLWSDPTNGDRSASDQTDVSLSV